MMKKKTTIKSITLFLSLLVPLFGSEAKKKQEEFTNLRDLKISAMETLHKNYPLTGIDSATQKFSKEQVKQMPIIISLGWQDRVDKIFEIAGKGGKHGKSQLSKDGKIIGWILMEIITFGRIAAFCIKEEVRLEMEEKNKSLEKQKELIEKQIALVDAQQKLANSSADILLSKVKKLAPYFGGAVVSLGALIAFVMLLKGFIDSYLKPYLNFLAPTKKPETIQFSNARGNRGVRLGRIEKGFYNEDIESILDEELENVKKWVANPNGRIRHIILYGEAGTGKTLLCKRICKDSGAKYFFTSAQRINQLAKAGGGQVRKELLAIIREAKDKKHKKAIIVINEADFLSKEDLAVIQSEFDKATSKNVLLLFTTNSLDKFPKATLRRFAKIKVKAPTKETLEEIIKHVLKSESKQRDERYTMDEEAIKRLVGLAKTLKATGSHVTDAMAIAKTLSFDDIKKELILLTNDVKRKRK